VGARGVSVPFDKLPLSAIAGGSFGWELEGLRKPTSTWKGRLLSRCLSGTTAWSPRKAFCTKSFARTRS
jgi:hypothetical protein